MYLAWTCGLCRGSRARRPLQEGAGQRPGCGFRHPQCRHPQAANRLPVRILTVTADDGESGLQADVRWLSPTAANLAKLTVPILAGFTEVPAPVTAG
jgi:hypothetical protein